MIDQRTHVYAIATDGPQVGDVYEIPAFQMNIAFCGHHYRFVGYVNGVAVYQWVAR